MAVMAQYDVKVHRRGFATITIVDLDGSEWLYTHGEASMGNGSAVVRFKGDEVVAASTSAAFFGSDASKTTVDGEMSVWNGAYNMSGSVEYAEKWDEMAMRATLNQMAIMAQYDVKLHRHGFATITIVDLDGSEWLYTHAEASMGNGSALVRFKGD